MVPCSPTVSIFSDEALTKAAANPFPADSGGNFGFWAAPGDYAIQISGSGVSPRIYYVSVPCTPGGLSCGGGTTSPGAPGNSIQFANAAATNFSGAGSLFYLTDGLNPAGGSGPYLFSADPLFNITVSNAAKTAYTAIGFNSLSMTNGTATTTVTPGNVTTGTVNATSLSTVNDCVKIGAGGLLSDFGAPCGGGSSILGTNNTFTGTNQFNQDVTFGGPNPYYDLRKFGLYFGAGSVITCSLTAGGNTATCPGGVSDFAVGQGIAFFGAGPAPTFTAWGVTNLTGYARSANIAVYPYSADFVYRGAVLGAGQTVNISGFPDGTFNCTGCTVSSNTGDLGTIVVPLSGANNGGTTTPGVATLTSAQVVVTPQGILNGSTTYSYKVVLRGYHGELSAASNAGTTTTGAATLGVHNSTLTSCSRTNAVVTCTTSSAHNFGTNVFVNISGATDTSLQGQHIILTTPTSTTFTFNQPGVGNNSSTGGSASVVAKNLVQWNMHPYITLQGLVYRSVNGGAYSFVGMTPGMDGSFVDWGIAAEPLPIGAPSTPPSSTVSGTFSTTITGISGTTLTLAANAGTTVSSAAAEHDNTPVLYAGCAALGINGTGTLYIPATNPSNFVQFQSPVDLFDNCPVHQVLIDVASEVVLNDPLIMKNAGSGINGVGPAGPIVDFGSGFTARIDGNANPLIYYRPGSFGPNTIQNINLFPTKSYQACVVEDSDAGGGNVVHTQYLNDYCQGNSGMAGYVIKGGFDKKFDGGSLESNGGWGTGPEIMEFTIPNSLGMNPAQQQFAYFVDARNLGFSGHAIEYDDWGNFGLSAIGGHSVFSDILLESGSTPLLAFHLPGSTALTGFDMTRLRLADSGGSALLLSDVNIGDIKFISAFCGSSQALIEGPILGATAVEGSAEGCGPKGLSYKSTDLQGSGSADTYSSFNLLGNGTTVIGYQMDTPAPPTLAVSAGGSLPVGGITYFVSAFDTFGGETVPGTGGNATTTSGNQTVVVTRPALPLNSVSWMPYRFSNGSLVRIPCFPLSIATTTFTDTGATPCGVSALQTTTAVKAGVGSQGMSASQSIGNQFDFIQEAAPANPVTGFGRMYYDSTSGQMTCLNSSGANCFPGGGTTPWNTLSPGTNSTPGTYKSTAGTFDFTGVAHTLVVKSGLTSALPATCTFTAGAAMEVFLATDATAGQNFYFCTATNTWTQQLNSSSAATAFSALTPATNSTAGSFIATGNTWNFSGSTLFRLRAGAGATTSVNGDQAYDTTNNNWHAWANGVDNINLLMPATATPANNDCPKFSVVSGVITLTTSGAPCAGAGVTSVTGTSPIVSSGGTTPAISCPTCTTNAAALTANHLVVGNGGQATTIVASLGTTNTVYHGNAAGVGTFGAVNLASDVTGILPTGNLPGALPVNTTASTNLWFNAYNSTTGVFGSAQPGFTNLTGSASCAQLPALTGDTTSTAGGCATVTNKIAGNFVLSRPNIVAANCNNTTASSYWNLPTSNAATPQCNTGTNIQEGVLQFADGQSAQFGFALPSDWTSTVDIRVFFLSTSTSGTVNFNIGVGCAPVNGSVSDDVAFNSTALGTVTLSGSTGVQWAATATAVNTTGCSAGNVLRMKLSRSTDTAAGTANVEGVELTVRRTNAS